MSYSFVHSKKLIFTPQPGSAWADEMVLNPAIIKDPKSNRIHMLFRATGPWPEKQLPGKPLPYPIFLGYAYSDDNGESWHADFEKPALTPTLSYDIEGCYIENHNGQKVPDFANGCVEDPRLFFLQDKCYVIVASRMLPPGPYWEHDEPTQCSPDWIADANQPFGKAASENVTNNVLFEVNLDALATGAYHKAFKYMMALTDPAYGENRDVLIFPEKLRINGKDQYVMLHRPFTPHLFPFVKEEMKPSMLICASENLDDFFVEMDSQTIYAVPEFEWEKNRMGGSTPPIRISDKEWLLCYHGKQDATVGYTQSFMILEEQPNGFPGIKHRCSERLIIADQDWEMPNKFTTPCIFITGLIKTDANTLMISYGAADEKVAVAKIDYQPLLDFVRLFDSKGQKKQV